MAVDEGLVAAFTIRPASSADVTALATLIAESVRALSEGFYSKDEAEHGLERVFGVDTQLIVDGTYYIVEHDSEMVGCGGWSRRRTLFGGDQMKVAEEDTLLDPSAEPARIRAFFVRPAWARRGIGGRILRYCEEQARTAGFSSAELVATLPGEPLYAAYGYQRHEEIRVDVGDGVVLRGYRMSKALRPSP